MYADAEAFAHSTTVAQRRTAAAEARRQVEADEAGAARRAADRLPHSVRAMVPEGARRSLRKALRRER